VQASESPLLDLRIFCRAFKGRPVLRSTVQQIYARLVTHIDAATSLLLKQDLVDAEFVREQNQRTFAKLNAIQDAALMRSSSQVPVRPYILWACLTGVHLTDVPLIGVPLMICLSWTCLL
jgi:hypothetical protein